MYVISNENQYLSQKNKDHPTTNDKNPMHDTNINGRNVKEQKKMLEKNQSIPIK